VRAEADAKLGAVKPLADAYRKLVTDREEFTTRDATNVAAVRTARAAALKAGFTVGALNDAGYREISELAKPAAARKAAAKKSAAPARRTRQRAAAVPPPKGADAPSRTVAPERPATTA